MKINIADIKYLFDAYIIKNIKRLLGLKVYNQTQEKVFNNIKIGDKAFCMMPFKPINYLKIKPGHRNRPYIIVNKDDNYLYGYMCTTHPKKHLTKCEKCKVEDFYDGELRTSYVVPNELYRIPIDYIISKQAHIDNLVLSKINRLIYMMRNRKKDGERLLTFNVKTSYYKGDVIFINNEYHYIYSIYNHNVYAHKIYLIDNDELTSLKINSQFKAIDFNTHEEYINLDIKYLYDYMTYEEIKIIDEAKKEFKYQNKDNVNKDIKIYNLKFPCGSIMQYPWNEDELYVYLFSINNSNFLISLDNCEDSNFKMININLKNFEVVDILTKESIIDLLNELNKEYEEYHLVFENIKRNINEG